MHQTLISAVIFQKAIFRAAARQWECQPLQCGVPSRNNDKKKSLQIDVQAICMENDIFGMHVATFTKKCCSDFKLHSHIALGVMAERILEFIALNFNVHIFWERHKLWRNHPLFLTLLKKKISSNWNLCGLLRKHPTLLSNANRISNSWQNMFFFLSALKSAIPFRWK